MSLKLNHPMSAHRAFSQFRAQSQTFVETVARKSLLASPDFTYRRNFLEEYMEFQSLCLFPYLRRI
jgi:hypothetical protein